MIIKFNPAAIDNIPKYLNEQIKEHQDQKYIMFIYNDLYDNLIDPNIFFKKYETLMEIYSLPYSFFPYYIHFNKVLTRYMGLPRPKIVMCKENTIIFDIVNQTAYGMLMINTEMIRNSGFTFDQNFKKAYYVQDLIEHCFAKGLYISANWFMDVHESYTLVKETTIDGFKISVKDFSAERDEFLKNHKQEAEQGNKFVEALNAKYKGLVCQLYASTPSEQPQVISVNGAK